MGLLDKFNTTLQQGFNDPIAMGLLAYGMTGQGNNPAGAAMSAMMQASQAKAKQDDLARQKAQQAQIAGMFAGGSVDPATLAQYSMGGGEGAKDLLDLYKFGRTPQSVAPGQMMIDPTTGKMSMPAPKMGEGQMWDGQQVTSAPGYLQAYGAQKAVDAQNAVDQYAAQQGIGYQYDLGRMGQQNRYDIDKMGYGSELGRGDYAYQQGVKDASDYMQTYNPDTGQMEYTSKADMRGGQGSGGYVAAPSAIDQQTKGEQAKYNEAQRQSIVTGGTTAAKQMARLNQLSAMADQGLKVGGMTPVWQSVGNIAADMGIDVKGLPEIQQAQKVILQLAQDIPLPPGAASNIDVQQRLQQLPNITDTPEAFAAGVQAMQELADINMAASEYVRQHGYTPDVQSQIDQLYAQWGKGQ